MLDAPRSTRWTALASAVGLALACGGSAGGEPRAPAIDFAPVPAPSLSSGASSDGFAGQLGLPLGSEMLKKNEEGAIDLLYPSAFDATVPFTGVREHLEAQGWGMRPTDIPPFEAMFTKDDQRIQLTAERAGSSVWIRIRTK